VLTEAGATAMGATSAEAAFRAFRLRPPDVLIADVALVANDGYWLIQRVRALPERQGGQVPAIAISGQVEGHPEEGRGAGFHAYAVKPIDPYQLVTLVRTLLRSRG
jgi:DNA-binding response OmpR family regulator